MSEPTVFDEVAALIGHCNALLVDPAAVKPFGMRRAIAVLTTLTAIARPERVTELLEANNRLLERARAAEARAAEFRALIVEVIDADICAGSCFFASPGQPCPALCNRLFDARDGTK